eukprot:g2870.t1
MFDDSYETLLANATDFSGRMDLLKHIRRRRLRYPAVVLEHGQWLLNNSSLRLGDEIWSLREQVFQAALDEHDADTAGAILDKLLVQFPDSNRVLRLVGLQREAEGKWEEAEEIYDHILSENSANGLAHKRKICVLKAQGKTAAALAAMNTYLDIFQGDTVAWQELADMHLAENNLRQAMYCYEELLLAEPVNHMLHTKYAEMCYTAAAGDQGGADGYRMARVHYAQALQLNSGDYRSALGLAMATQAVASCAERGGKGGGGGGGKGAAGAAAAVTVETDDAELNRKLHAFAKEKVAAILGGGGAAGGGGERKGDMAQAPADLARLVTALLDAQSA